MTQIDARNTVASALQADVQPRGRIASRNDGLMGVGIRSNLVWMIVGTVWSGACQWAQLVALAKLGTVDMVGTFTLGLAIALPVLMFNCLNLRNLFVTDHACEYRFREYFALRLLMSAVSLVLVIGIAAGNGLSRGLVFAISLVGLAKVIEYISDLLYGLLQREESMAAMAISMMLRGTLSLCALSLGVYLTGSLMWGALGLVLSSALTLLAFDLPVSLARLHLTFSLAWSGFISYAKTLFESSAKSGIRLRSLAIAGAPLGLVLMLISLNVNIPRYFVAQSLGIGEQGIFSSLANLIAVGSVFINALGQCLTPRMARYFATGDLRSFRALLWALVLTSVGLGVAGLAVAATIGTQFLTILYRPEYATRQDVFIWLMGASGAIYLGSAMGVALTAARCFTPQLPLFALSAAVTAVACVFLVPAFGLQGAAVSIFLSSMVQSGGGVWLLRRAYKSSQ